MNEPGLTVAQETTLVYSIYLAIKVWCQKYMQEANECTVAITTSHKRR